MLSAKTERGVNVKNLIELSRKATRGKILQSVYLLLSDIERIRR